MQPLPVAIDVGNSFYPLSVTPATCLTEYLPHQSPANCLLAHALDPRKIFYTLFSEQNNGFSRVYNITCCDTEHAGIARSVLLLSCLLDNPDVSTKLWNIFHDFYIGPDSMDLIQTQSEKLIKLSESLEVWANGAYGKVLRMVNSETLHALRDLWSKYSKSNRVVYPDFRNRMERVFVQHYKFSHSSDLRATQLSRSFGIKATGSRIISNRHTEQFWKNGVADIKDTPKDPISNPLFLHTSSARAKFVVNHQTNPLAIFHLVTASHDQSISETSPPSSLDMSNVDKDIEPVVVAAKSQFSMWCTAFQQVAKESRVVIRFVAADPTAFCLAVQQQNFGTVRVEPSPIHSSIWSGTPLKFDGDLGDSTPVLYNVIDTSLLIDHVGALNVFISTVPLLEQSSASTIHTDTISRPWSQEPELLPRLLTSDVTWMCALLNIAPIGYLTASSTCGLAQEIPIVLDPSNGPNSILNRIIWKIPASGDLNIDLKCDEIRAKSDLAAALFLISNWMVGASLLRDKSLRADGSKLPFCAYTEESVGLLFAFLKRRVILDWDSTIRAIIVMSLSPLTDGMRNISLTELGTSMHFAGVYSSPSLFYNIDGDPLSEERHSRGVLGLPKPPIITCIVFTVPRRNLRAIYDKCFASVRDVICSFEFRLYYSANEKLFQTFRSPTPIFGNLIVAKDGKKCQIRTDKDRWHGVSDLHLCVCLPTTCLLSESPNKVTLSVNIVSDPVTTSLFRNDYGSNLEIARARLFDDTKVQLVRSFPGCSVPKPVLSPDLPDTPAQSNSEFRISYPEIRSLENQTKFVTRITLISRDACELLKNGSELFVEQISPCTLTITYATAKHVCQFPYPIQGNGATVKVARKSSWIEVTTPLCVATKHSDGGYSKLIFPLLQDSLCSWNLPSINFSQLPRVHGPVLTKYVDSTLPIMFADNLDVDNSSGTDHRHLKAFKLALAEICGSNGREESRIFCLGGTGGTSEIVVLVVGRFIDSSSHNIVLDAYVLQMTDVLRETYSSLDHVLKSLPLGPPPQFIKVRCEDIEFWKAALPSMVERCRNWEHKENCESVKGICSCGLGKVGDEFLKVEGWAVLKPYVVRAAISPVFPVPYVTEVRAESLKAMRQLSPPVSSQEPSPPSGSSQLVACQVCGKTKKTKKCGGCGRVYYCGQKCQTKDWTKHKVTCR